MEVTKELALFGNVDSEANSGLSEIVMEGLLECEFMRAAADEFVFVLSDEELKFTRRDGLLLERKLI